MDTGTGTAGYYRGTGVTQWTVCKEAVAKPLLSAKAWARVQLAWVRAAFEPAPPPPPDSTQPPRCFAVRRVVVPRGVVSWVRAGTRRPL